MVNLLNFTYNKKIPSEVAVISCNQVCSQTYLSIILPFNLHTPWMDLIYNINGSTLALKCLNNIATRTTLGFFVIQEKKY